MPVDAAMRVAHVSFFVDPAGRAPAALLDAWPTLANLAPAISTDNVVVTVVQAASADALIERDGVQFQFVRERRPSALQRRLGFWSSPLTGRVGRRLVDLSPDIIHIHSLSFPRHVRQVRAALPDTRIIVQDHADQPIAGWRRNVVRASLDGIDAASFTAAVQAKPFLAAGVLNERARIFEVPESSSMFTPGDQAAARSVTGLHGDPCVLWLGHLDENKDPLVALDAIRIAASFLPDIRLWMAWLEAPLLDVVRQCVQRDAVLRERVMLLGPQPHSRVQTMLRAADLLIQASHNEGSGYAVIEAIACGTAPVVTDIPSFRVLTGEGGAGGLSPIGDAAAMAASLGQWAAVPAADRRARVRDHFERNLSFHAIGARWRAIYQDVLAG